MELESFCRLTPWEFEAAYEAAARAADEAERAAWERARSMAAIVVAPHCKRPPRPKELLPLPWDKPEAAAPRPLPETAAPTPKGRGERLERLERMVRRANQTNRTNKTNQTD